MKQTINNKGMRANWFLRMAIVLLVFAAITKPQQAKAQTLTDTIQRLYGIYDSMQYLSFDVRYVYTTDTVNGETETEQMLGSYTMSRRRALYRLGNIEFMQNDSVLISVYHDDKIMMITPRTVNNAGSLLPLREAIDSMVSTYSAHYTITHQHNTTDSISTIHFEGDSIAPFAHFYVLYNRESQLITEMRYIYYEEDEDIDLPRSSLPDPSRRKRKLTLYLDNYRFDNISPDLYDPSNYAWKEGEKWTPVRKYIDYRVYSNQPL
ncbi:MAG: hypothetical protein J0G98_18260 [Terrimonas ferruginea]|uniref:hypothetical protein n=1 Tax=Terrimonas ferruginea TaxID=249 RepID=UPI001AC7DEC5|nr:hypothetical protein [Terrimonas ferruginea]MBN8785009.1 hypothetical protein [Terrimonas ferruginea]